MLHRRISQSNTQRQSSKESLEESESIPLSQKTYKRQSSRHIYFQDDHPKKSKFFKKKKTISSQLSIDMEDSSLEHQ